MSRRDTSGDIGLRHRPLYLSSHTRYYSRFFSLVLGKNHQEAENSPEDVIQWEHGALGKYFWYE